MQLCIIKNSYHMPFIFRGILNCNVSKTKRKKHVVESVKYSILNPIIEKSKYILVVSKL